jgi:hypothetical protein
VRVALLVVAVTACGGPPAASLQGLGDAGGDGGFPDAGDAGDAGCIMPVTCDAGPGLQGCVDGGGPTPIGAGICPPHSLPLAEVGERYETQVQAECGVPPYRWTTSPDLPAGLVFNLDGTMSGTPIVATDGSFVFAATVTDETGVSGSGEYSLQIVPAGSITICDLPGGCPGLPICGGDGGD